MYAFTARIAALICFFIGKIEVYHPERLPTKGGFVCTCPHRGWLEIVILGISLPRKIHFMAKKELFANRLVSYFLRRIHAFPIDRTAPSPSSIKTAVQRLRAGEVVGIFPSGTRSTEALPAKRGAVTIASLAKVPIVPTAYMGPKNLKEFWQQRRAVIIIGEPMILTQRDKESIWRYTKQLEQEMQALQDGFTTGG